MTKKLFLTKWLPLIVGYKLLFLFVLAIYSFMNVGAAFAEVEVEDTEVPGYVDGLAVTPGDGEATLTWDAATDNVGVTGYNVYFGTEPVEAAGDEYNLGSLEVGDVLEYTVPGLENGVTYYFAITAVDDAENESESYSFEESATPDGAGDDGDNPTVLDAEATDCTTIEVTFSEAVTFPAENAGEAFTIENLDNLLYLEVTSVSHSDDGDEKLILTTEEMDATAQYIMTVGVEIEDRFDHAVISGTSDTAILSGAECAVVVEDPVDDVEDTETVDDTEGIETDTEDADVSAPNLEEVVVTAFTELELTFDEEVYLPADEDHEDDSDPALEAFEIFDGEDNVLEVTAVEYKISETDELTEDQTILVLTTSEHAAETEYFIAVTGVLDVAGNETAGDFSSAMSYATPEASAFDTGDDTDVDVVAPEDVTEFVTSVVDLIVDLNWAESLNSAGDLVDQVLYVSSDGGNTYEEVGSVEDATEYTYEGGVEGQTYLFKVVTVDEYGNMSEGTVASATLPTTGAGIALLGAASLFGGSALARRRRRK
ncbi:hypothetical protein HN748_00600 [Candidatus Peregrinibacteria bacterium]|jgi:hypothetical protein|nr:hypothetical protein [Candidatus Peregrinibacteria bacterium]MBT7483843.1 hypothetical protein [Candidatus Peregrinibacteria bacterium]MBT7702709.1 hypothetical protein [Candidatus Peregrinibacteria bacterium]